MDLTKTVPSAEIYSHVVIGHRLLEERKYSEAEEIFKRMVYTQEKTLDGDDEDMLESGYWVFCIESGQRKYVNTEKYLQEVLRGCAGVEAEHTFAIDSKYYLGYALIGQGKYSDAEFLLRTVVEAREKDLGKEHDTTLHSKYNLAYALYGLQKYSEAEKLLQEVVQTWGASLGEGHESTLASQHLLGLVLFKQAKFSEAGMMLQQAADGKARVFGEDNEDVLAAVRVLKECQLKTPQPYPVPPKSFGWQVGEMWGKELNPSNKLTKRRHLGGGRSTLVEEVVAQGRNESMVRKQISVSFWKDRGASQIQRIMKEIDIMRDLSHTHIVTIIDYYQEYEGSSHGSIYVLMYPVGDNDLNQFTKFECTGIEHEERCKWIKKWFVCLSSALAYMHSEGVIHEDIKPHNIIHRGKRVFFTDFGSSRRIAAGDETSTTSEAIATRFFAAPEAFRNDDGELIRHGSKTDVFSLGLVFVELLVVLAGKRVETLRNYAFGHYKTSSRQYHRVSHKFKDFFLDNAESVGGDSAHNIYNQHFECMLHKERKDRPSAKDVLNNMKKSEFFEFGKRCECARGHIAMEHNDGELDEG